MIFFLWSTAFLFKVTPAEVLRFKLHSFKFIICMQQRTSFHFCLSFFFVACLQDMWVFGGGGGVKKVRRWRCRWTDSLWKNQFRKIVTLGHKNYSTKVVIIIIYALTCNNVVLCFCLFFLLSSLQTAVIVVYQSRYYIAFVYYVIYVCFLLLLMGSSSSSAAAFP